MATVLNPPLVARDGNRECAVLPRKLREPLAGRCARLAPRRKLRRGQIAELRVYSRAPGTVVRCPSCGNVVIVLVEIRGETRVVLAGFALLDG